MTARTIPLDPQNPGEIFACLGFLELASELGRDARGGFSWDASGETQYQLTWREEADPVEAVLQFLAGARVSPCVPRASGLVKQLEGSLEVEAYPAPVVEAATVPCLLENGSRRFFLTQWVDGSDRPLIKQFAGGQSAPSILSEMLLGAESKGTMGVRQLLETRLAEVLASPFGQTTPLGASFKLDARGAWTTIDVGYSIYEQGHGVLASPVVEVLAAVGLENARPRPLDRRAFRYSVWRGPLPIVLARAAVSGAEFGLPMRQFRFEQVLSGKYYKVLTFGKEGSE